MVWFRYLSNKEMLGTTNPNENYSYPLLKRQIPKFTPKDTVPEKTWLFTDVAGLNIDKYYDTDLQIQTDDASYIVVYEDPYTDNYFLPVPTVINEGILYFETAEEHLAGVEIGKQYSIYYKTKGLRKIVEVDNGGRKDYQIFDLPIWIDKELPAIRKDQSYSDAVYAYSVPPATYSISRGRLPNGILLDPVTGAVTGTTSYEGLYSFTIRATSIHGYIEAIFSNEIGTGPSIPTGTIPNFYFGQNYNYSFAIQSSSPVRYFIFIGSMPDGVSIDEESGYATGIVNLNTSNYSDVQYNFTIGYENEFGTTYKTFSGYVYHSPDIFNINLNKVITNNEYLDHVQASGYPSVIYSLEKYNLTSNGITVNEDYSLSYNSTLNSSLLEFNLNSTGEYLTTSYPQIMDSISVIEPDPSGGFYISGNFTSYDSSKLPVNETKKILYINSSNQLSTWSLKRNSLNYYSLGSISSLKVTTSNIYAFGSSVGFYENSTNQVIDYKLGIISKSSGEILDLNLHLRLGNSSGAIKSTAVIGSNIYVGGSFSSVNLPPSSTMVYDVVKNTSIPNYPISFGKNVYAFSVESSGGYYVGGNFTTVNGIPRNGLAYINSIGKLSTWNPNVSGTIYAIGIVGSNIYVGGNFSSISNQNISNFAVVTRFGQVLNTFLNVNGTVRSIDIIGSNIYFGGNFSKIYFPIFQQDNTTLIGWNYRNRPGLAAINTQGTLLNWRTGAISFDGTSNIYVVETSGTNIYFGGNFTDVTYPVSNFYNVNKSLVVSNVIPEVAGNVYCVTADNNGGYYIGGDFHYVDNQSRNSIAYINSNGSMTSWNPQITGTVYSILAKDNNVYIGGSFSSSLNAGIQNFIAISTNGQSIISNISTDGSILSINFYENVIYLSGSFTSINNNSRNYLAAINTSGNLLGWNPSASATVRTVHFDGDNIYFGGDFTSINGNARNYLALINTSGNVLDWNPSSRGSVNDIKKYGSNIYIGGNFAYNESNARSSVYTTNSSGNLIGLNYGVGQNVNALQYDNLGGFYIGGSFTSINGQSRNRLAYINSSGGLGLWNPSADGEVYSLLVYGEGATPNIYFGGNFNSVSSNKRNRLAATDSSGNLLDWNPQMDGISYSIKASGENIYIGGDFKILGAPGSSLVSLNPNGSFIQMSNEIPLSVRAIATDNSGGIYIGGDFTSVNGQPRGRLAYVDNSGNLGSWNPSANANVYAVAIAEDRVYVGGKFQSIGNKNRNFIAAVDASGNVLDWDVIISNEINPGQIYVQTIATIGTNVYASGFIQYVGASSYQEYLGSNAGLYFTGGAFGATSSGNVFWRPRFSDYSASNPDTTLYLATYGNNVYVGGDFRWIDYGNFNYIYREKMAAFDSSGNILDWNPSANGRVMTFTFSGDNIYIGGIFTSVGGQSRSRVAAINTSGNVLSWNPNVTGSIYPVNDDTGGLLEGVGFQYGIVTTIDIVGENVFIGGYFTSVNGNARNYLAVVNTLGSVIDTQVNLDGPVFKITSYGNNVYVGGWFRGADVNSRRAIGAVNTSGNVLPWNPVVSRSTYQAGLVQGYVYSVFIDGNNIYIGGRFDNISGSSRLNIGAVNTSGTLLTFNPTVTESVRTISISGTTAYIGGEFLMVNSSYRRYAAALNVDQTSNLLTWNPNVNAPVKYISSSGDNVYLVGDFTLVDQIERNYAASFDSSGNLLDWNPSANSNVKTLDIYGSNITIGGDFYDINSLIRPFLYAVDESANTLNWNPVVNGQIRKIYIDGQNETANIYIAGDFTFINNVQQKYIGILDLYNAAVDWSPNVNNSVYSLDVNGDNVYFGGLFDFMHRGKLKNMSALNVSGNLLDIQPQTDNTVRDISVFGENVFLAGDFQSLKSGSTTLSVIDVNSKDIVNPYLFINGGIRVVEFDSYGGTYIGGDFTSINGLERNRLAYVDQGGNIGGWNPSSDGSIYDIAVDGDNIYVVGDFNGISGQPRYSMAAISKNGKLLDWNPPVYGGNEYEYAPVKIVRSISIYGNNIFVAGTFLSVKNITQKFVAKLNTNGNLLNWSYNWALIDNSAEKIIYDGSKVYLAHYRRFVVADGETAEYLGTFGGSILSVGQRFINDIALSGNNIIAAGQLVLAELGTISYSGIASMNTYDDYTEDWVVLTDSDPLTLSTCGENIYVGGNFNQIGGFYTAAYVYDKDGQDLTNFYVRSRSLVRTVLGYQSRVYDFEFDENGGMYIAGEFEEVNKNQENLSIIRPENRKGATGLAYMNSSGLFSSWNPNINGTVFAVTLVGDNIYFGGNFTQVNGATRRSFAVMNTAGSLLFTEIGTGFNQSSVVYDIKSLGSNIYIAGSFTDYSILSSYRLLNSDGNSPIFTQPVSQNVYAIAVDINGGAYIGGDFTSVDGQTRNRLAYINSSGLLDSWDPNANGTVHTLTVFGDNIYIGGAFTSINQNTRNRLAAANTSGSLLDWNPNVNQNVYTVAVDAMGATPDIYFGGNFTTVSNNNRSRLAAVSPTGNLLSWNPSANNNVFTLAIDNSIVYIGGAFTLINGNTRNRLAAVNTSGNLLDWNPNAGGNVMAMSITQNAIYLGGVFTNVRATTRNRLASVDLININTTGNLLTWNPNANGNVLALSISGSNIYIGGSFTSVNGNSRNRLAAVDTSGNVLNWNPNANANVTAIATFGANIHVGGNFTILQQASTARNRMMAINTSGNVISWNPNINNVVNTIAILGDNIYIGGNFTSVNGNTRNRLAVINTSGNVLTWNPNANNTVYTLAISGDNIYIGGIFSSISNNTRNRLAVVNTSGNLLNWNPFASSAVHSIAVSGDNIYFGGNFTAIGGNVINIPGNSRNYLAAVNTSGHLLDWNPEGTNNVLAIAISGDNIYIGSDHKWIQFSERKKIALLNSSGAVLDWSYDNVLATVHELKSDCNKLYIGTLNNNINMSGTNRNYVAAINSSNKILSWNQNIFQNIKPNTSVWDNVKPTVYTIEAIGNNVYYGGLFQMNSSSNSISYIVSTNIIDNSLTISNYLGLNNEVYVISSINNNIYVGGSFTDNNVRNRSHLLAINTIGRILDWAPSAQSLVESLQVYGNNIYIGGNFTYIDNVYRNRIAGINISGNLLGTHITQGLFSSVLNLDIHQNNIVFTYANPNYNIINPFRNLGIIGLNNNSDTIYNSNYLVNNTVFSYTRDSFGGFYIGGNFTSFYRRSPGYFTANSNGSILPALYATDGIVYFGGFSGVLPAAIYSILPDNLGGFYIGGNFQIINGQSRNRLAHINSSGNLDSWNPNVSMNNALSSLANMGVYSLARLGDNIYIGGYFEKVAGESRKSLAVVNTSGSLMPLSINVFGYSQDTIYSIAILGSNVYFGGLFNTIDNQRRSFLAAVNTSGSLLDWNPSASWIVRSLAVSGDNIYMGGDFLSISQGGVGLFGLNQISRNRLAAVNTSGSLLDWNPNVNSNVLSLAISGNNIYIGGNFTSVNGNTRNYIAAVNTSGNVLAWNPNANGNVLPLSVSGDNIYFGGSFTTVAGQTRNRLAAVNISGSLLAWNPNVSENVTAIATFGENIHVGGGGTLVDSQTRNRLAYINSSGGLGSWNPNVNGNIFAIILSGSNIYFGGSFTSVGGQTRNRLAAVDTSGSLLAWNPNANANVTKMTLHGDNIYVTGIFTLISSLPRYKVAAISRSGTVYNFGSQTLVNTNSLHYVNAIAVTNNVAYIGGYFEFSTNTEFQYSFIVDSSGSIVNSGYRARIFAATVDDFGGFYVGGNFSSIAGQTRLNLAYINSLGGIGSWNPSTNGKINDMIMIGDNIYIGGDFTSVNGQTRNYLATINTSGSLLGWNPSASANIYTLDYYNSNIYVGGKFNYINNKNVGKIAIINTSGSVFKFNFDFNFEDYDNTLQKNIEVHAIKSVGSNVYIGGSFSNMSKYSAFHAIDNSLNSIYIDQIYGSSSDYTYLLDAVRDNFGGFYVGGYIQSISGQTRNRLAYINSSGGLGSWNPSANGDVAALVISGDNIYFGGSFTTVAGQTRNRLAAVNTSGSLLDWNPSASSQVVSIAISGNNIYIGGWFNSVNGNVRNYLAAVNTSGNVLPWNPNASSVVRAFAISGDNIYMGGSFTSVGGQTRNRLAAVNTSANVLPWNPSADSSVDTLVVSGDNIYMGGFFDSVNGNTRNYIAAVNTSGNVLDWNPSASSVVDSVTVFGDNIYFGGWFGFVGGQARTRLAAVNSSGTLLDWNPNFTENTGMYFYQIIATQELVYTFGELSTKMSLQRNRNHLMAASSDGSLLDWNPNVNNNVYSIDSIGSDIYFGGSFTTVAGQTRNRLAAVNASGSLLTWNPDASGTVSSLSISDNNIYIAGDFGIIDTKQMPYVAVINTSGQISEFNIPNINQKASFIYAFNSKIIVSGDFEAINEDFYRSLILVDINSEQVVSQKFIVSAKSNQKTKFTAIINEIKISGDNIYIGGDFNYINNIGRNRLAGINTSGKVIDWGPNVDGLVKSIFIDNNNIYVGGEFSSIDNNQSAVRLAKISKEGTILNFSPKPLIGPSQISVDGDNIYIAGTNGLERDDFKYLVMMSSDGRVNHSKSIYSFRENNLDLIGTPLIRSLSGNLYVGTRSGVVYMDSLGTRKTIDIPKQSTITINDIKLFDGKIYVGGNFKTDALPIGINLNKNNGAVFGRYESIYPTDKHRVIISAKNELGYTYKAIDIEIEDING